MLLSELFEDGRIVKGVNTTKDVSLDELVTQARKFGFTVNIDGEPPRARPDGKFQTIFPSIVERGA